MRARAVLLTVATCAASLAPTPAAAWPSGTVLPAAEEWDLLPVRDRERAYVPIAFDGHVHTSHSHDADHPTHEVLELAERLDLDAIVLTDHGSSHATLDLLRRPHPGDLAILVGEEVGGAWGHAVIWNVPERRGVAAASSTASLGGLVHARGGVLVLAHPGWWIDGNQFDPRRWMQYDALRRGGIGASIDAIEIWNQVYWRPTHRLLEEWDALLERGLFVPIVGASDFHRVGAHDLGTPRTVALCPEAERDRARCLLEAVRAGRAYLTDGPTVSMRVAGRTLGGTAPIVPGTPIVVEIRARAPLGGTLELHLGRAVAERIPLPAGALVDHRTMLRAPHADSFVRVEIVRERTIEDRIGSSLLTNPIMLDVAPWSDGWRGPDVGRVRAPFGFSREDVARAARRQAAREEQRRARRAG